MKLLKFGKESKDNIVRGIFGMAVALIILNGIDYALPMVFNPFNNLWMVVLRARPLLNLILAVELARLLCEVLYMLLSYVETAKDKDIKVYDENKI